ncbi:alpha-mannosidase 2-like [Ruditapes philippinarum]|uniref:alpha-mannosidase 2-like n=1 Tax=Ruditapes philippinarum TaxID=129788 RepID=UPI00295ADB8F|nr:alpha-mannosidase 2-like [Ruditapes philippinarum]XP_060554988.1 alpha-mannosidase 2-like [Ruditapes philippinarum]XP_060554989.1 alpha-mannosidase 2-like [Ruditapes philippinarum]XP_060554991.1 alpha-mannosidase 2-like [Ruditapes philippinarum]
MKFQQRLMMVSSAAMLGLVFILLLYSPGVMHVPSGHHATRHRRALSIDYDFDPSQWSASLQNVQCEQNSDFTKLDNATIFTQNLPEKTNYNLYKNNQYKMQHPQVEGNKEMINVIILPHSHVDAGWLQSVEEYYVNHVKGILNNMVKKLNLYKDMTFVWAETVFLSMWWNELEDDVKYQVRRLLQRGQLEIALGGWVMSDEASTHYPSVIDQLMEGQQWVSENLHTKPVNSWAIDPFGHSGTMPYLWKQSGMENMVIQRVHQAIKATLVSQKALEFNWRQNWDFSGTSDILCHVMPYVYYGMQYACGPDKQICAMYDYGKPKSLKEEPTGREITKKNIASQARYLHEQYKKKAGLYKYSTVLVPVGDDFRFDTSQEWDKHYHNYKKVIEYINKQNWNMTIQFGTLKDYFRLLRHEELSKGKDVDGSFPVLKGDFFPYSDQNSEYWTGYFSTRPFHKQLSRDIENNLRSADILSTLAYSECKKHGVDFERHHDVARQLQEVRRNLGLFLHHDAITGTAKPHVVEDYENKLLKAFNLSQDVISITTQNLLTYCEHDDPIILSPERYRRDAYSLPGKYTVAVMKRGTKLIYFNPVAHERTEMVTLVVDSFNIEIKNSQQFNIPFQINPVFKSATNFHESQFEIVFQLEIPAFGFETYTIYQVDRNIYGYWSTVETLNTEPVKNNENMKFKVRNYGDIDRISNIENEFMKASFDKKGVLNRMYDKSSGTFSKVELDFMSYSSEGSGAYIFYPSGKAETLLEKIVPKIRVIKGLFMEQIQVVYKNIYHSMTLFDIASSQGQGLHIENKLDMRAKDMSDHEIIMRINSDVKNVDGSFYTDQNGYQLIGRKTIFNRRIETNYYPVTTMVVLEDSVKRLTLHTKQSHGVASLHQGSVEVMLDRKVMSDDNRGLGEGVFDNRPTISNFILHFERKSSAIPVKNFHFTFPSLVSSVINEGLQQPIQTMFTTVRNDILLSKFHPKNQSIPCDMSVVGLKNLVTSDLVYNGSSLIIHRRKFDCNYLAAGLQCPLSRTNPTLSSLLPNIPITSTRETTLTHLHSKGNVPLDMELSIRPMEMMSFLLDLS